MICCVLSGLSSFHGLFIFAKITVLFVITFVSYVPLCLILCIFGLQKGPLIRHLISFIKFFMFIEIFLKFLFSYITVSALSVANEKKLLCDPNRCASVQFSHCTLIYMRSAKYQFTFLS